MRADGGDGVEGNGDGNVGARLVRSRSRGRWVNWRLPAEASEHLPPLSYFVHCTLKCIFLCKRLRESRLMAPSGCREGEREFTQSLMGNFAPQSIISLECTEN